MGLCNPTGTRWIVICTISLCASMLSGRALAEIMQQDEAIFRVMSFNIRYDNPGDGTNAWPLRRDAVAELIKTERPDIAGLQEALLSQIDDLQTRLPSYDWHGVGRDDGKQRGEFVPIFYRRDRFEPLDTGTFWLSETPNLPGSKSWDAAITRLVTWMKLKDKLTGRTLYAFNTHFDHLGWQARIASAHLLLSEMRRIAGDAPVVLTGDFNTVPSSTPYRIITTGISDNAESGGEQSESHLDDARRISAAAPIGPNSTWNGFQEVLAGRQIDFIFVRGIRVITHAIVDERPNGRFLSDHLPVWADLKLDSANRVQ